MHYQNFTILTFVIKKKYYHFNYLIIYNNSAIKNKIKMYNMKKKNCNELIKNYKKKIFRLLLCNIIDKRWKNLLLKSKVF